MESFFEGYFKFNPANVDRFTYSDVDAVAYYTLKRQRSQQILFGLTVISVALGILTFGLALFANFFLLIFALCLIVLTIGGVSFWFLRRYYWNNFSLKIVHRYQKSEYTPNLRAILIERSLIAQAASMGSLLISLSIAFLSPAPLGPPPPPTLTLTPSLTYTPSITFTPSISPTASDTPTPTNTHTPTPTPTFVYYVSSPRTVAIYVCPDVSCEILAQLPPDSEMVVVNDDGAWVEIRLADSRIGYIASFLTSPDPPNSG